MKLIQTLVASALLAALGTSALARGEVPKAEAESRSTLKKAWDKLEVSVSSWAYGPSLTQGGARTPMADGSPGGEVVMTNQFSISFKDLTVGGLQPTLVPTVGVQLLGGLGLRLQNPSLGLAGTLLETADFSWWARFETVLPLTGASWDAGLITSPQMVHVAAYRIPSTRFTARLVAVPSFSVFASGATSSSVYLSPQALFKWNDKFWSVGLLEAYWARGKTSGFFEFKPDLPTNAGLGFRYFFTKDFWVQPFFNFYPERPSLDTSHVAFFLGGQLK